MVLCAADSNRSIAGGNRTASIGFAAKGAYTFKQQFNTVNNDRHKNSPQAKSLRGKMYKLGSLLLTLNDNEDNNSHSDDHDGADDG